MVKDAPTMVANGKHRHEEEIEKKVEFGGWTGAVSHIVGLVLTIGVAVLACNENQCELRPFAIPTTFDSYFNANSFTLVIGFICLQAVLLLIPYGQLFMQPDTKAHFRANGILSIVLTFIILGISVLNGFRLSSLYDQWVSIAFAAYTISWAIAIFLYLYASTDDNPNNKNPYSNSGNFIYDLYMGRQFHPMLFGCINVKFVVFRFSGVGSLLLETIIMAKAYELYGEVNPTLLMCVVLQAVYVIDALWFEHIIPNTFEYRYEGAGLMCVQGFLTIPFLLTMICRYIMLYNVQHTYFSLAIRACVYAVGYLMYRMSNLQKAKFRANPDDPALSHLETITTSQGRKLLVSGWWGFVKHPNYLGDIILMNAWASLAGLTHALPYMSTTFSSLLLIHRTERDDRRCADKYGKDWEKYDKRVPYFIFPGIY